MSGLNVAVVGSRDLNARNVMAEQFARAHEQLN